MVRELHESLDVDLRKCRRSAKLLARERSDLRLGDALDLVAKEALRDHYARNSIPPHPWTEQEFAEFTWGDLMWLVWDIHPDGTLERTWTEKGLPGGLVSRIVCPVLSTTVKPFISHLGQPVLRFDEGLSQHNELRYRVSQEPHGDGVLQTITINHEMRCFDPGTDCSTIEGRHGKCCKRVELGTSGQKDWRSRYSEVIEDRSRKAMAGWLLKGFARIARAPIYSYGDEEYAWLTTTPTAKARMAGFREVESKS